MDYFEQYEGRTFVVTWQVRREYRYLIGKGPTAVSAALDDAMRVTGITAGVPGIIPESIRFRIE